MTRFTQEYKSTSGLVFFLDPNTRNDPLPGIDTSVRVPYKNVFFGAEREYKNDDEGWTRVVRKHRGKNRCKVQNYEDDQQSVA